MARQSPRLPKRFPDGTRYVVEGRAGVQGVFHVSARYVVFPNGRRVDLLPRTVTGLTCKRPAAGKRRTERRRSDGALRLGA